MADVIRGTFDLYLYRADGVPRAIATLRDATISITTETVQVANPHQYGTAFFLPGTQSWTGSADLLYAAETGTTTLLAAYDALEDAKINREVIVAQFSDPWGNTKTGEAIITGLDVGGSFQDAFSGSFTLQGRDELLRGTPPAPSSPSATGGTTSITVTWT